MYDFSYCVNCITSLTFFEEPSITSSCNECVKFHLPSSSEVTLNVASPPHKQSNFLTSTVCNTTPLKLQPLQQTQQVGVIVTHAVYRCYSWSVSSFIFNGPWENWVLCFLPSEVVSMWDSECDKYNCWTALTLIRCLCSLHSDLEIESGSKGLLRSHNGNLQKKAFLLSQDLVRLIKNNIGGILTLSCFFLALEFKNGNPI